MSFFGKWSFRRSRRKEPRQDPVLPAMLWRSMNPKGRDIRLHFQRNRRGIYLEGIAPVVLAVHHLEQIFSP
jgi:hypothetical protein